MRRVTHSGQPLIEARHPLGPRELPSTLRYLNDRYYDFERALPFPGTGDPAAWRSWRAPTCWYPTTNRPSRGRRSCVRMDT